MATKKPVWVLPDGSTVGQKDLGKVKPTPKPTVSAPVQSKSTTAPKPKITLSSDKGLPTLEEWKSSAASRTMSYKEYLDYFKRRGGK